MAQKSESMIGKKHNLEWSQKGPFSLWFGSGLHAWASGMTTKNCYSACVCGSGMPISEIFQGKLLCCCWFPGIPKSQSQWRHGKVQKSHHPKDDSQDLTNQIQSCRCLKRKLRKEKGMRKVGIQDRPSKVHSHQCCARTAAQNYR